MPLGAAEERLTASPDSDINPLPRLAEPGSPLVATSKPEPTALLATWPARLRFGGPGKLFGEQLPTTGPSHEPRLPGPPDPDRGSSEHTSQVKEKRQKATSQQPWRTDM